jgi:ketosteroid isomerase-like protein
LTAESRNVEAVRRGYEAFNSEGISPILEMLDPEIEWRTDSGTPDADTHHGLEDVRAYMEGVVEPFESLRLELEECIPKDDQVLAGLGAHGRVRGSEVEFESKWWHLWTVRELRGVEVHVFFDRARALDAMGVYADPESAG